MIKDFCDNCGYCTEVDWYEQRKLCNICANTRLATATERNRKMPQETAWFMSSTALLFNVLIDALDVRDKFDAILLHNRDQDLE